MKTSRLLCLILQALTCKAEFLLSWRAIDKNVPQLFAGEFITES